MGIEPIQHLERAIRNLEAAREKRTRQSVPDGKFRTDKRALWRDVRQWASGFSKSEYFARLFADDSRVIIYQGTWGHTEPKKSIDCWSRVALEDTGGLFYEAGTKWGMVKDIALAEKTPPLAREYLRAVQHHLTSGRVYTFIARQLEDRARIYA